MTQTVSITPSNPPAQPLAWLLDICLPYWAEHGVNKEAGSFVECLDHKGRPQREHPTRLRVQARQTYVFSHAYRISKDERWAELARMGFEFLTRFGWADDPGGWVHRLTPAGDVLDDRRDAYDHAFVLFALAWYGLSVDKTAAMPWIERSLSFLDAHMTSPDGGFFEERLAGDGTTNLAPGTTLPRRQNPHMHLLEAFLALHDLTGDPSMLDRAGQMIDLFKAYFFDQATGSLAEFFTQDWQLRDGVEGMLREPGHQFEWVWLLHQYAGKDHHALAPDYATSLYQWSIEHGTRDDAGRRIAIDNVLSSGTAKDVSARLWPQTEMIKAGLIRAHTDDNGTQVAHDAMATLFRHYLDQDTGIWCDQIDAARKPVSTTIPASSLYHIMVAFTEWERLSG